MISNKENQITLAQKELSKNARRFRKCRQTKPARIEVGWLKTIRKEAKENKVTISKMIDRICLVYFRAR